MSELITGIIVPIFSALLQGGALIAAGVLVGSHLRRLQSHESMEKMAPCFSVELVPTAIAFHRPGDGAPAALLEVNLQLKNLSNDTWMLPGVYLSARSMPCARAKEEPCHGIENHYSLLRSVGELSEPKNLAFLEHSIYQVGPNETETLVGWILLDEKTLRDNPIFMIHTQIFVASHDLIGFKHGSKRIPQTYRQAWISMMRTYEHQLPRKVPFHRNEWDALSPRIHADQWILLKPEAPTSEAEDQIGQPQIDEKRTEEFSEVLETLWMMDRLQAVDVASLLEKLAARTERQLPLPWAERSPEEAPTYHS